MLPVIWVQKDQFILFKKPAKQQKEEDIFCWYVYAILLLPYCSVILFVEIRLFHFVQKVFRIFAAYLLLKCFTPQLLVFALCEKVNLCTMYNI